MEAYAGKQFVGIDLHRRRSVIVRTTEAGEVLETVRIVNDVEQLASVMSRAGECPEVVLEATGLPRIHCPIPAVGGLQHHLRALTSPGHHRRQPLDVIDDPHRLQHLTTLGGPDDHRPATVQIDSHKLLTGIRFHLGRSYGRFKGPLPC